MTKLWSAMTCHRFRGLADSSARQSRVPCHVSAKRRWKRLGEEPGRSHKFDGDKSPPESADKSAHSKAFGCGVSLAGLKLILAFTLVSISVQADAGAASGDKPPCCREPQTVGPSTDKSLYQLDSVWTSDVGKDVKLGVLRGRPQVLALFFTSCEFACPIIVQDMKRIQEALAVEFRGQVDFVLVTMDSERDTPAVLRKYRVRQNLGVDHWTLLRGRPDDVRELAALLGVNYQKDARGQFSHSNVITVLNVEGEIVFQQVGLNQSPSEAVKFIARAAASIDEKGK